MNDIQLRPVLEGQKALLIGIANKDSIAYGCAKAFRSVGADLAVSWLNEKARGGEGRTQRRFDNGIHCR
jgi:enoyl-[acyl-carrier protein] reductase I